MPRTVKSYPILTLEESDDLFELVYTHPVYEDDPDYIKKIDVDLVTKQNNTVLYLKKIITSKFRDVVTEEKVVNSVVEDYLSHEETSSDDKDQHERDYIDSEFIQHSTENDIDQEQDNNVL